MSKLLALSLAVIVSGCSALPELPTAPTPTATPISDLRWDMVAPGCAPLRPLPPLADVPPTRRFETGDGLRALWLVESVGATDFYVAVDFKRIDKVWAFCDHARLGRTVTP
jgi:hypothetical protein